MQVTGSEECGGGGRFHRVGKGQKIRISLGDNFARNSEESLKISLRRSHRQVPLHQGEEKEGGSIWSANLKATFHFQVLTS